MNKDPDVVPEQAPLIILDRKYVCMAKNGKDTKHTRQFSMRMQFVRNGEAFSFQKKVWCEGGLQLSDIGKKQL